MFLQNSLTLEILKKYPNEYFLETGTFQGHAVELALEAGFKKIISIEIDSYLHGKAKEKFAAEIAEGRVELILGDTAVIFEKIVSQLDKPTTFWIDDHWSGGVLLGKYKCPLPVELEVLKNHPIKNHTLLIDDTRMFGHYWGLGLSKESVIEQVMAINPDYKIQWENGIEANDIMVALPPSLPLVIVPASTLENFEDEQSIHLL
jgi:hypothetical protein